MVVAVGRQRRPRRRSYARCARPSAAAASSTGDDAAGRRRARRAEPRPRAPRRGSRRPGPFEQVNLVLGMEGAGPRRRPPLRARRAQHRARRRHVARGCSRRSASGAAWPTRSSRSPATTPTPAWSGVSVGCLPSKLDDVLAVVRAELARVAADGITDEELARGKGQLRGRTGARPRGLRLADVAASARPSSSTTSCSASTRCWPGSTRSPSTRSARVAARASSASPRSSRSSGPRSPDAQRFPMIPITAGSLLLDDARPGSRRGERCRRPSSRCWATSSGRLAS